MKTAELTGIALDWAVAVCEGLLHDDGTVSDYWQPSELWEQGGPIIERERISVFAMPTQEWEARTIAWPPVYVIGDTPLLAAMRCYVASKLGDEVEVPKELTE